MKSTTSVLHSPAALSIAPPSAPLPPPVVSATPAAAPVALPVAAPVATPVAVPVAMPAPPPFAGALSLPVAAAVAPVAAVAAPAAAGPLVQPHRVQPRACCAAFWLRLCRRAGEAAVWLFARLERAHLRREWLASAAIHAVLIVVLGCLTVRSFAEPRIDLVSFAPLPEIVRDLEHIVTLPPEAHEALPDTPVAFDPGTSAGGPLLAGLTPLHEPLEFSGMELPDDPSLAQFASHAIDSLLGQVYRGATQRTVHAGDAGGAVDRLTVEILRQLERNDVLLVWLMDASNSLRPRREDVVRRFDRIYDELGVLSGKRHRPLLTGVVAFGQNTVWMTPQPTADRDELARAVRDIPADESGQENVFQAVQETVGHWRKSHGQARTMMLVVLTDEAGDDADQLDAAVQAVTRARAAVYVIGPMAPFGQREVSLKWSDPDSQEEFRIPVTRGPETIALEHARLLDWGGARAGGAVASGFGPYALTRLVQASGGIYLLADDGALAVPDYNDEVLAHYAPDYLAEAAWRSLAEQSPLRRAVVAAARSSEALPSLPLAFLAPGIQFEIRNARRALDPIEGFIQRELAVLEALAPERRKESSLRWRAHYDLLTARLLACQERLLVYRRLLDEMYKTPRVPTDTTKNAWQVASPRDRRAADAATQAASGEAVSPAAERLRQVVDLYPQTPWAELARRELEIGFELAWRESFLDPPPGIPLPWDKKPWEELNQQERAAKAAYEKRQTERKQQEEKREEARKRLPNL